LFPIVHDEHIKRIAILNEAMENVESLTRSQYMDDEVGLLSSSAPIVGLQSLEVSLSYYTKFEWSSCGYKL